MSTSMSTEVVAREPVITPEVAQVPHAGETNAAVAAVAAELKIALDQHGDPFDQMRSLRRTRGIGWLAAGTAVAGYHTSIFYFDTLTATAGNLPIMAGAGAAMVAHNRLARRTERHHAVDQSDSPSNCLLRFADIEGCPSPIEVFDGHKRSKTGDGRTITWRPSPKTDDVPDEYVAQSLSQLKTIADGIDAQTVGLPYSYVKDLVQAPELREKFALFNRWFRHHKQLSAVNADQDPNREQEMMLVTNAELDTLIERAEVERDSGDEPLGTIIKVLEQYRPHHQAVGWHNRRSSGDNTLVDKKMRGIFKNALERQLTDTHVAKYKNEDLEQVIERSAAFGRVHIQGDEPVIEWRQAEKMLHIASTNLLGHHRVTLDDLKQILAHPESFSSSKVVTLCELAGWLTLVGHDVGIMDDEMQPRAADGLSAMVLPDDNTNISFTTDVQNEHYKLSRRANRENAPHTSGFWAPRFVRNCMIASGALIAGTTIGTLHQAYADDHVAAYHEQHNKSYDVDNPDDPIVAANWQATLLFDALDGQALKAYSKILQSIGMQYDPGQAERVRKLPTSGMDELVDSRDVPVGNIPTEGENKPVWYIQSFGDMSAAGYWGEDLSSQMWVGRDQIAWTNRSDLYGLPENKGEYILDRTTVLDATVADQTQPHLRLQREANFGPASPTEYIHDMGSRQSYHRIAIPVLNGTKVVAANIDGKPADIKLHTTDYGASVLLVPEATAKGYPIIEYWLAPDDAAPKPTFVEPLQTLNFGNFDSDRGAVQAEAIDIWQRHTGSLPPEGKARIESQKNYIRDNFEYELQPIDNGKIFDDINVYAEFVLDDEEANCNVAATLLNLGNPNSLNLVSGYYNEENDAEGVGYLSVRDAHAWNVDEDGEIHDSTPASGLSNSEQEFFKENYPEKAPMNEKAEQAKRAKNAAIVATVGLATLGLLVKRRAVARRIQTTRAKRATKKFERYDDATIHRAAAVVNHLAFAEPNADFRNVTHSKIDKPELSRERIETFATTNYTQTKADIKAIKKPIIKSGRKHIRKLKRDTRRVLKTARNKNLATVQSTTK